MADAVLCLYSLPPREEAVRRGFVRAWGEERAFAFWEGLHRDLLYENGAGCPWDLVVMTSTRAAVGELGALAPPGTRVELAPGEGQWGLEAAFARLAGSHGRIVLAAGDLPGLTQERVSELFRAFEAGARVAFLRERQNRFSAIGMAPFDARLMRFDFGGGGRFWDYLGWLEERGLPVFWQEERLDDLPGPEWVVPVLGFAARRMLPSMEAWPVRPPPQPELVLVGRLPAAGRALPGLAAELARLPGGPDPERAAVLAASVYRAMLFDRMDGHRGRPHYRCVGAFPFRECSEKALLGSPEALHPLPEVGPIESWLRDVLCDLDESAPRVACASDVPVLPEEQLEQALGALKGTEVVLGPSPGGDYNLVGMHRFHDVFEPDWLESGNALERVRGLLRDRRVSLCILPEPLRELTTLADLRWFQERLTLGEAPRLRRLLDRLGPEWSGRI